MTGADALLEIEDLSVEYAPARGLFSRHKPVRVLDRFNLRIRSGETLAVVGESGCGKTTLANSIARFVPAAGGAVRFEGRNILEFGEAEMRAYRREMQMVFQNPFSSLDPRMRVEAIVAEPLVTHARLNRVARAARVGALLEETGLRVEHAGRYPHELSGGQAQRVALARALALNPKLLLLDEPTSALDVSVQAQILNLLRRMQDHHRLTYMLISHSLGVVQHVSDRIAVLYLGEIVEQGPRAAVFATPRHPYTQALFAATPIPDPRRRRQYAALPGTVPSPADPPAGCRFHTRCPYAMPLCRETKPPPQRVGEDHWASCHLLARQA
jgi:peptide/nickel transport system ATP-binding protein/oligopeptide transport system ATP-binding protein